MLHADNITVTIPERTLLCDVTFAAHPGRCTAILGPNGAGKSTLLRVCAGLLAPNSGAIAVQNQWLTALKSAQRARLLAYVPQNAQMQFSVPLHAYVRLGRFVHEQSRRMNDAEHAHIVDAAIARVALTPQRAQDVRTLSGGEWMRAQIARALAQATPLLLLDEPTAFLDIVQQHRVLAMLKTHAKENNAAVVCVLHDVRLAAMFADDVVLLREGKVIAQGAASNMLTLSALQQTYDCEFARAEMLTVHHE